MGCTSPIRTPYRETGNPPPLTSNPLHKLVASNGTNNLCVLSALEFDDMGVLLNRKALERTYEEIARLRETRPIMLVIYVHGWKHSAAPGDHNLASFVKLMTDLAASRMRNPSGLVYTPVGVYIGWRGNLADFEKGDLRKAVHQWQNIAYYNRDAAAKRVSGPTATEVLLSLAGMAKARSLDALETLLKDPEAFFQSAATNGSSTVSIPTDRYESRVVIAGHSMGGLIVENAVSQATLGHLAITRAQYESAQTFTRSHFGDLDELLKDFREARTNRDEAERELSRVLDSRATLSVKAEVLKRRVTAWDEAIAARKKSDLALQEVVASLRTALTRLQRSTVSIAGQLGVPPPGPTGNTLPDSATSLIEASTSEVSRNAALADVLELGHLSKIIATNSTMLESIVADIPDATGRAALTNTIWKNVLAVRGGHREFLGEEAARPPGGLFLNDGGSESQDLLRSTLQIFVETGDQRRISVIIDDYRLYLGRVRDALAAVLPQAGLPAVSLDSANLFGDLTVVRSLVGQANRDRQTLADAAKMVSDRSEELAKLTAVVQATKGETLERAAEVKAECAAPTNTPRVVLTCADAVLAGLDTLLAKTEQRVVDARHKVDDLGVALRMRASAEFIKTLFGNTLPADLILLINPASSALTASKMSEALNNPRVMATNVIPPALMNGNPFQLPGTQPLIINISSKADSATRAVFPLAHGIAAMNKRFIDSGQRQLFTHTARNVPQLVTHHLVLDQESTASYRSRRRDLDQGLNAADRHERFLRMNLLATNGWVARDGQVNRLLGNRIIAPGERVYRLEENSANSSTGYWVVDCAEELLPGHNDFWTPEFYSTVAAMIRVRRLYDLTPRALQTNQGEQAEVPGSTQHTAE